MGRSVRAWLLCGAALLASPAEAGLYPSFPGPGGSYLPPGMSMVVGMDGSTPCLIGGGDTSCVLPMSSSGGGGGGSVTQGTSPWVVSGTVSVTGLGSPFQAGGSIGNTGFNVTGTLPAFAAIPTFKVDQTTPGTTNAVALVPITGTGSTSAVTVGVSSAQALASGSRKYLSLDNESTTATIACNFGSAAAINTAGSYTIPPGSTRVWGAADGFVPSEAVNCIASAASTPLTVASN